MTEQKIEFVVPNPTGLVVSSLTFDPERTGKVLFEETIPFQELPALSFFVPMYPTPKVLTACVYLKVSRRESVLWAAYQGDTFVPADEVDPELAPHHRNFSPKYPVRPTQYSINLHR